MTPELERIVERCRLPVLVRYSTLFSRFQVIKGHLNKDSEPAVIPFWSFTPEDAKRYYLKAVASIQNLHHHPRV